MAIDLLNSFLQGRQNVSSGQADTKNQIQSQAAQKLPHNIQVIRAVRALQAGQTIQGEILSVKGEDVQLAIMKDAVIEARLAQSMNVYQGMNMTFQIKSNNSQGLTLLPLFLNTSADPNAMKALDMAGITANDRTLEMVQTMMEKGMPIDKQSLQEVYRDVAGFKDASVRDIVLLHQLELPVTKDNLTQITCYQNQQHYLTESFTQIGEAIGKQLAALTEQGKGKEAAELLQKLENFINTRGEGDFAGEIKNDKGMLTDPLLPEGKENTKENVLFENKTAAEGLSNEDEAVVLEQKNSKISQEKKENQPQKLQSETELWGKLKEMLNHKGNSEKIGKEFERIWKKEFSDKWMLEPDMVAEKEKVVRYFEKLSGSVKELEHILEQGSQTKDSAAKILHNTSSNLEFMNQLNQLHAYIQLPLKMSRQNAQGELYVFTNKRSMNKKEDKVTALLHLDMENLGNMDVYVALEGSRVNTNFYLEKEEYLDFLEEHMDMLHERLQKRGYDCDIKTSLRNQEEREPIIKIMEREKGSPLLLSMQAFDMRA